MRTSNNSQVVGWTADGRRVTARHTTEARDRGAVGPLFDEYQEYERGQWWTTLHPLDAAGFRVNK